jgi:iron complex transport system substrate-binding protein
MGGFAQTWNLAGGSDLIAVTDDAFEDRDINLPEDVTSVGKFTSPNVEILIGLDPDLVILSSETPAHVALQHTLTEAGITTAYFNVTHFEDYLEMLRVLTDITGRSDLYAQNGTTVQTRIEEIIAETAARAYSPNIAFLITYSGGAAVLDKHTMTGILLLELGCVNITDTTPSLLNTFSMESLIAYDPDYIFIVPMGNDDELTHKNLEEIIESHPAWKDLSAVVNGHYILLPHDLFLYKPNARWAESYAYLADLLQESGDSSFGALDI